MKINIVSFGNKWRLVVFYDLLFCFLFYPAAVYCSFHSDVLDCSRAIHQGAEFHYLEQSAETEKGFRGGRAHSSCANPLCCSTEMFLLFSPSVLDQQSLEDLGQYYVMHTSFIDYGFKSPATSTVLKKKIKLNVFNRFSRFQSEALQMWSWSGTQITVMRHEECV